MNRELSRIRRIVFYTGLAVMTAGMIGLAVYGISLLFSAQTNRELQEAYEEPETAVQAETTAPAEVTDLPAAAGTAEDRQEPVLTEETQPPVSAGQETPATASAAAGRMLPATAYPDNPGKQISTRFQKLREKNSDIIGWLKMGGMVNEAVVQRDNEFYLNHDAMGKNNVNGALFLDAGVALKTRPYVYIIYGHNMRAGAEFGSLRNYENELFYQKDPFVSFDTIYDSGEYVIFSVGTVSVEETGKHFVDFFALLFNNAQEHQEAIDMLQQASIYPEALDVKADDQILLLVTCVEKDDERRVVAARRIRDGERKEELNAAIARSLH